MVTITSIIWRTTESNIAGPDSEYFFNKIISENQSTYKTLGISADAINKVVSLVDAELSAYEKELLEVVEDPTLVGEIFPRDNDWVNELKSSVNSDFQITINSPKSLILKDWKNSMTIITKDQSTMITLVESIKKQFEELAKTTKDFGLSLDQFITGKEYAEDRLKKSDLNIVSYSYLSSKNEFEKVVIDELTKITNCILSNINITFSKPSENFEYDILVPVDSDTIINIEVTDYETEKDKIHEKAGSLKNELILSSLDKAQRLKAQCIIIAKGFPEQTFQQIRDLASSRNIILLDDINYKKTLEKIILKKFKDSYFDYRSRTIWRTDDRGRRSLSKKEIISRMQ